jgi:hypothetical protein
MTCGVRRDELSPGRGAARRGGASSIPRDAERRRSPDGPLHECQRMDACGAEMDNNQKEKQMLKRFSVVGLCLVAVFAVSAVGAATASAKRPTWWLCEKLGTGHAFKDAECKDKTGGEWEEVELAGKETFTSTSGVKKLYVGGSLWIECKKDKDSGEIENVTISGERAGLNQKVGVTFEECVSKVSGCTLSSTTIPTKELNSLLAYTADAAEEVVDVLEPGDGTGVFTTVTFNGSLCVVKGAHNVGGSVIAKVQPQAKYAVKGGLEFMCDANHEQVIKEYRLVQGSGTKTLDVLTIAGFLNVCEEEVTNDEIELSGTLKGTAFEAKP